MSPSDEEARTEVEALARQLFEAENVPGDRSTAARVLAADYLPITRGNGTTDRDRDETLSKFERPNLNFHRHLDRAIINVDVFLEHRLAIARTLLPMTDASSGAPTAVSYRNMQVFLKRGEGWECVAWQVTKVQA